MFNDGETIQSTGLILSLSKRMIFYADVVIYSFHDNGPFYNKFQIIELISSMIAMLPCTNVNYELLIAKD